MFAPIYPGYGPPIYPVLPPQPYGLPPIGIPPTT